MHNPHVIWVTPDSRYFYRTRGEIRCRPGSVLPKLSEKGIRINALIPFDPLLLPKTRLASSRTTTHTIHLSQPYDVEIIKLTRGAVSPGVYMVKLPSVDPALKSALFSKAALALAKQLRTPVDIFHLFSWEAALLPLFLEMEKNGSRLFREARTFLNIQSLKLLGNFSPNVLSVLGIPSELFHPEGIEFYGQVSYLKTGLLFADGVGLIESTGSFRNGHSRRGGNGFEGVLDSLMHKLRYWASERSLKAHLDIYEELLFMPKASPFLPMLMGKLHATKKETQNFIDSWGPLPPDRYGKDYIGFLVQSPTKTYAFWECDARGYKDIGLYLDNHSAGRRNLLSRGLYEVAEYWIDVEPDQTYVVELVGWDSFGGERVLLRSKPIRTPRAAPSPNQKVIFVDVRQRRPVAVNLRRPWPAMASSGGASPAGWGWDVMIPTSSWMKEASW